MPARIPVTAIREGPTAYGVSVQAVRKVDEPADCGSQKIARAEKKAEAIAVLGKLESGL
jgi:hypothetical protein